MNNLQIFNNKEFGDVRVINIENEFWFIGKDITNILGYTNPTKTFKDHVDKDDIKVLKYKACYKTPLISLWKGNDYSNKTLINENGLLNLVLECNIITKDKKIKIIENFKNNGYLKDIGFILKERKEIKFISQLEEFLKEYNIKGINQYSILGYRIDYYIPKLKLAIEYDENNHSGYSYETQEGRQKQIEKELGCKFIRLSDNCSDLKNIAKVSKYIH